MNLRCFIVSFSLGWSLMCFGLRPAPGRYPPRFDCLISPCCLISSFIEIK